MKANDQTRTLEGVYQAKTFTPDRIKEYSVKYNNEEGHNHSIIIPNTEVNHTIEHFIDLTKVLQIRIKEANINNKTLVSSAIEELENCSLNIANLNHLELDDRGHLYGLLARIAKGESSITSLLQKYGDSNEVVDDIKEKAALISGIVAHAH